MRILCARIGIVLALIVAALGLSSSGAPPFSGTIFIDPDIVVASDPTAYQSLEDKGRGIRLMFDRRVNNWVQQNAYLFEARFDDGLTIEVQVNPEFSTATAARTEALRYMHAVGQMPNALRANVQTMWLHKGNQPFGGGNNNILIHSEQADAYIASGILEETLMHEAAHTSLDPSHATAAGWIAAQQADPEFISTYARDNPTREDVAETFVPYFAVQFRRDRIPASMAQTIIQAIPNRIAYLNGLNLNMHPAVATSPPPVPTITLDPNITSDDVINIAERAQLIRVTGSVGGDAKPGDIVAVTVNGVRYNAEAQANLAFAVDVPGSQLVADADLTIEAVVTSGSSGGVVGTASDSETFTYDLTLPAPPTLALHTASPDDPLKTASNTPTFRVNLVGASAAAAVAGDRVVIYEQGVLVGSETLSAADASAGFVNIQTVFLPNGVRSFTAIITDAAGNASDPSTALLITVEASIVQPVVTLGPITPDNVINLAESTQSVRIFGTVEGAKAGDPITLVIAGENFNQDLAPTLTFSFTVPAASLIAQPARQIEVIARTENSDGNVGIGVDVHVFEVDLEAPAKPVMDLPAEFDTGVSSEDNITSLARPTVRIAFVGAQENDSIEITVDGAAVIARPLSSDEASQGFATWTSAVDLNGSVTLRARLTDRAGNPSDTSDALPITIDRESPSPEILLNKITDDNILNLRESTNTVSISGNALGGAKAGDAVNLTVGGESYTTTLDASLRFALDLPGSALVAGTNRTLIASITTSDAAGNSQTAQATNEFQIDLIAPAPPTLDLTADSDSGSSATDNYTSNSTPRLIISITECNVEEGDSAIVFADGVEITRIFVTQAIIRSGEIAFQGAPVQDGTKRFSAAFEDSSGNLSGLSDALHVTIDTVLETIEFLPVQPLSSDGTITLEDAVEEVSIRGSIRTEKRVSPTVRIWVGEHQLAVTVTGDPEDSTLHTYEASGWGALFAAFTNRTILIEAKGIDAAGNAGTWQTSVRYDVAIPPAVPPVILGIYVDGPSVQYDYSAEKGRMYEELYSTNLLMWIPFSPRSIASGAVERSSWRFEAPPTNLFVRIRAV